MLAALTASSKACAKCLQAAVDVGFTTLHILPHVDPRQDDINSGRGLWRNVVKFDPMMKYGPDQWNAFSYEDVVLRPTAEALNIVTKYNTTVEFTLSAEQGRSVWYFPTAYVQLLQKTKALTARWGMRQGGERQEEVAPLQLDCRLLLKLNA